MWRVITHLRAWTITKAYLVVNTSPWPGDSSFVTEARSIARLVRGVPGVATCRAMAGGYQIVAETELIDLSQICKMVTHGVEAIEGVDGCSVCIVLGEAQESEANGPVECVRSGMQAKDSSACGPNGQVRRGEKSGMQGMTSRPTGR